MDSFGGLDYLQDRINRMNARKSEQKRNDEEFVRKQKIRMFINDCDDIRPNLRNQLLKDSKLCQLEQMKDQQRRYEMKNDLENAWHEIQSRDHQQRTEREKFVAEGRSREGLSIQEFLKQQMEDKKERSMKIYEEINDEQKQVAKICKEEYEQDQQRLREDRKTRKAIGDDVTRQIKENREVKEQQFKRELKFDQINNERIRKELERDEQADQAEKQQFRRDVFGYLDHLMVNRRHNNQLEQKKEKLINDIRKKAFEEDWQQRCETFQKRLQVNQVARVGQVEQIKRQEKLAMEEATKEKQFNAEFNQRELEERQRLREAQWQKRVRAYHYGQELMEQRKSEELRDIAWKQKINEELTLAALERNKNETMGREFVNSFQDVLPLHPNLIILKGKQN